jgi:hypothetical protein
MSGFPLTFAPSARDTRPRSRKGLLESPVPAGLRCSLHSPGNRSRAGSLPWPPRTGTGGRSTAWGEGGGPRPRRLDSTAPISQVQTGLGAPSSPGRAAGRLAVVSLTVTFRPVGLHGPSAAGARGGHIRRGRPGHGTGAFVFWRSGAGGAAGRRPSRRRPAPFHYHASRADLVVDLGTSTRLRHGSYARCIILPVAWLSTAGEQWDAVAEPHEQRQLKSRLPLGQLPALCG